MNLIIEYLDGDVYSWETDDVSTEKGMLCFSPIGTENSIIHIPHCVIRKYMTEWLDQEKEGFIALEDKVTNGKDVEK